MSFNSALVQCDIPTVAVQVVSLKYRPRARAGGRVKQDLRSLTVFLRKCVSCARRCRVSVSRRMLGKVCEPSSHVDCVSVIHPLRLPAVTVVSVSFVFYLHFAVPPPTPPTHTVLFLFLFSFVFVVCFHWNELQPVVSKTNVVASLVVSRWCKTEDKKQDGLGWSHERFLCIVFTEH